MAFQTSVGAVCVFVLQWSFLRNQVDSASSIEVSQDKPQTCPPNFFLPRGDNSDDCRACAVCPAGYETRTPCTEQSNTTCNVCAEGTFSPGNGTKCRRCSKCPPGTYVQRQCTGSVDTVCTPCKAGTFSSGRHTKCMKCRRCPEGKYEKRRCSQKRNTKCQGCRRNTFSPWGKTCEPCKVCPQGSGLKKPCTKATNTECEVCPSGMTSTGGKAQCKRCSICQHPNQTQVSECTSFRDTVCLPCPPRFFYNKVQCVKCSFCRPGEVLQEECTETSDTVCAPCPSGTYSSMDQSTCLNCSTCPSGWRVTSACSKSRNTACRRCSRGTYASPDGKRCHSCSYCPSGSEVKKSCTSKRDTRCRKCDHGYYSPGHGFPCRLCSLCPAGMYVHRKCTRRRDTVCKPCPEGTFLPTWSSSPACSNCSTCSRPMAIMRSCTNDRNVQCGFCSSGHFPDAETQRCAKCSYCYPDRPGLAVKEDYCWREPKNYQCRPLVYSSSINLTYSEFKNLISENQDLQAQTDDRDVNQSSLSASNTTPLHLPQNQSQIGLTDVTWIAVTACATLILTITVLLVFFMVRRHKSMSYNRCPSSSLSRSVPPPYSSVVGDRDVTFWLSKQFASSPKTLCRSSWPAIVMGRAEDPYDVDNMSTVSFSILSRADVLRRLEERLSENAQMYQKAHSFNSDSLPVTVL